MTDKNSIRLLWRQGDSVAEIARKTGVSRDTVYKYRDMDDFSPKPPARRAHRGSKLDPYRPLIESWLDDDMRSGRKQRHTAKRVHDRLVSECGADVSVSTVERCVREIRARRSAEAADAQYLDLVWGPGEAQADFGEADFYVRGMRTTLSFFVMTFPYSNVGLAQVFPGETSECVCQALRNVFEHVGGVPTKIVFDNATGVGRRVGGGVRTTELFAACSAHYGFRFRFCNPRSGNEKGSVENKVGCVRRNLFVPVPQLWDAGAFNRRLLERSLAMSDKPHWIKGERELDLFEADRLAMLGLPAKPLDCVTYVSRTADKKGKVSVGERGRHLYSTHPSLSRRRLTVGLRATTVSVYDPDSGELVCEHPRAYGSAPTDTSDPASQLALLAWNAGGWENSRVREALPDELREHMDSLDRAGLKALDGYDFSQVSFPDGYGEADLRSLAFIDACQDFVFHGKTGRGKTHLAIAVGAAAVRAGKSVRFFTVAQLVMHLADARDRGRLRRELDDLLSADLLVLDELGYVPLDVEGARLLFQVMSAPEGTQSLIVTTNIEFSRWGTVFGDDKMAAAVVDRLVYTGRLVEFNGASYRMENALMLGKGEAE